MKNDPAKFTRSMLPHQRAARGLADIGHRIGRTFLSAGKLVKQMFNPNHSVEWIKSRHKQREDGRPQNPGGATFPAQRTQTAMVQQSGNMSGESAVVKVGFEERIEGAIEHVKGGGDFPDVMKSLFDIANSIPSNGKSGAQLASQVADKVRDAADQELDTDNRDLLLEFVRHVQQVAGGDRDANPMSVQAYRAFAGALAQNQSTP